MMLRLIKLKQLKETNGFKAKAKATVMSTIIGLIDNISSNIPVGTAWLAINFTVEILD